METLREFVLVVVGVELGPKIDVALRAAQRAEVSLDVFRVGLALDHRGDHEGGIDHLAEAELLARDNTGPLNSAAAGLLPSISCYMRRNSMPSSNVSLISLVRQVLLERLDGRVVAARLEADRDRHAGKIGRVLDRRIPAARRSPDGATE